MYIQAARGRSCKRDERLGAHRAVVQNRTSRSPDARNCQVTMFTPGHIYVPTLQNTLICSLQSKLWCYPSNAVSVTVLLAATSVVTSSCSMPKFLFLRQMPYDQSSIRQTSFATNPRPTSSVTSVQHVDVTCFGIARIPPQSRMRLQSQLDVWITLKVSLRRRPSTISS